MNTVTNEAVYELQNKYNLNPLEVDQITTSFFATYGSNSSKELLEQHIKGYLITRGNTEAKKEAETEKEVDTNSNGKGFNVIVITHPDFIKANGNEEFATYGRFKMVSNFEGVTLDEWNNYIQKRGYVKSIINLMEGIQRDYPNEKILTERTLKSHTKKLANSDKPMIKSEKHNGKSYYKLLNCVMVNSKPNYFVRIPYQQMRELVIVTNGNMLRLYALVCSILQAKGCGYDKYHPITRSYLAECLGYSTNTDDSAKAIGTMLTALCNLGHLERLETTEIDKENNTYKSKYSYRRTTLAEWQEAKKRGTIKK